MRAQLCWGNIERFSCYLFINTILFFIFHFLCVPNCLAATGFFIFVLVLVLVLVCISHLGVLLFKLSPIVVSHLHHRLAFSPVFHCPSPTPMMSSTGRSHVWTYAQMRVQKAKVFSLSAVFQIIFSRSVENLRYENRKNNG